MGSSSPESSAARKMKTTILPDARVLDAEWLDSYLMELLWQPTVATLSQFRGDTTETLRASTVAAPPLWPPSWTTALRRCKPEILLLLHLGTLLATGTTPAARLLRLEWKGCHGDGSDPSNPAPATAPNLAAYCAVRLLARAYQRYYQDILQPELVRMRHEQATSRREWLQHSDDDQRRTRHRALQRQEWLCHLVHKAVAWARAVVWFGSWAGTSRFRTPSLSLWVSGNYLAPQAAEESPPSLHVNFAYRRWLWKESMAAGQILLAGLPLAREVWQPVWEQAVAGLRRRGFFLANKGTSTEETRRGCPLCGLNPMTLPVRTNCGHEFCYTCLYQQFASSAPFRCSLCRTRIARATPLYASS